MIRFFQRALLLILPVMLVASCRNFKDAEFDLDNPSPFFKPLFQNDANSVFRGISFGLNADEVKKLEKAKLYESTPDHLFYEFSFPADSAVSNQYVNIQYFFKNGTLDIITANIFLKDSLEESHLRRTLQQYYQQKLGDSEEDSYGYEVWSGTCEDKRTDKEYPYTLGIKKLEEEYGLTLEFMAESIH